MASSTFLPSKIPSLVSSLLSGQKMSFCLGTETKPFAGKQCHVYVVCVAGGKKWGVRVPIPTALQGVSREGISSFVKEEVEVLKRVEESGFSKLPELLGYDGGFDNVIGFPYVVSGWVDGVPVVWNDTIPRERGVRDNFLKQLARIQIELWECTQNPAISTTTIYLTKAIDRQLLRVTNNQLPGLNIKDCLFLRSLVPKIVHPELENAPWVVTHDDLMPCNVIVDEEWNIRGVIDWGYAKCLPLQFAGAFPRLLAREVPDCLEGPVPCDIVKFSEDFLGISDTLKADREVYISELSKKSAGLGPLIAGMLRGKNVDWRGMMWKATMSKGEHRWMAERGWLIGGLSSELAIGDVAVAELEKQVDLFLEGEIGRKCMLGREELLAASRG